MFKHIPILKIFFNRNRHLFETGVLLSMALALKIKDINNYNSFAVYNGDGIIKPEVVLYDEILTQDYYYAFKNIPKENALIVAGTR